MEQQIRLIASDLDGTLLRDDRTLSSYTRSVLKRCRTAGILFFAVTARPPRALESAIPGLEYDGAICHNGAVAILNNEIVWEQGIEPALTAELIRRLLAEFPGIQLAAEIGGDLYANFRATDIWPGAPYLLTDYASLPDRPSEKWIVALSAPEEAAVLERMVPESLSVVVSENRITMIQPKDVDKGKALEALWQRLGLSASQAVGFGDDWNDLSLLHACGTGIAVENALPAVKAAADGVCPSNREDGVAQWLEDHLL